jgi:hypothetical protein
MEIKRKPVYLAGDEKKRIAGKTGRKFSLCASLNEREN